jgi:predicted GIY-YIG superfamily endonuclease
MTYLVYILKSDKYSYVGMTNDFLRRFRQHNKEIKGGAKYTSKREDWYPVCIIDGFETMVEAMQCEWAVKHSKKLRGPQGRIIHLSNLLKKEQWTSKSPKIKEQTITIYIDDEYKDNLNTEIPIKELYWKI